jgi:hypothetical protein
VCGEDADPGQAYCLECGLRLPPAQALAGRDPGHGWVRRAFIGLLVAGAGAAAAVAATGGTGGDPALLTATGGFASTPTTGTISVPTDDRSPIVDWPASEDGWTIALATLPQDRGRRAAVDRAREAAASGLSSVGVLDSSQYASLHPGYWIVFTGIYTSEAEATSALAPARAVSRTAGVRRIVP